MNLVDYDSDESADPPPVAANARPLGVPAVALPPPTQSDDGQVDERGKKRRWAHTEGLWPSLMYVEGALLVFV